MGTIKCARCNLVNWTTQVVCKRCGTEFELREETACIPLSANVSAEAGFQRERAEAPPPGAFAPADGRHYRNGAAPGYQSNYQNGAPKLKVKLAVISMILGIIGFPPISFFLVFLLILVLSFISSTVAAVAGGIVFLALIPAAPVTGIAALRKASKQPYEYGGKGFAIAGIALGSVQILIVPIICAIAIPNLLAARRAANEGSAISTINRLKDAEASHMAAMKGGCGDVKTLIATRMIDTTLASGEKNGYRFEIASVPAGGCEIHAVPTNFNGVTATGKRSFFASSEEGWKIRAAEKSGRTAGRDDELLEDFWNRVPVRKNSFND